MGGAVKKEHSAEVPFHIKPYTDVNVAGAISKIAKNQITLLGMLHSRTNVARVNRKIADSERRSERKRERVKTHPLHTHLCACVYVHVCQSVSHLGFCGEFCPQWRSYSIFRRRFWAIQCSIRTYTNLQYTQNSLGSTPGRPRLTKRESPRNWVTAIQRIEGNKGCTQLTRTFADCPHNKSNVHLPADFAVHCMYCIFANLGQGHFITRRFLWCRRSFFIDQPQSQELHKEGGEEIAKMERTLLLPRK